MMRAPKRILFFAEAVTLAHVARPLVLAKSLDSAYHEVVMACDSRYQRFLECESWPILPLHSIGSQQFLQALANGSPVYDDATLRGYVREDIELIEQVKPDLIVGDFRLSLSVSARLAGIPYATITNAYWSPYYAGLVGFPLPVLPMTRILPLSVAGAIFRLARPLAFGLHCKPLNRVRQENGLPSLGADLRRVYTDADYTLYADIPALFPTGRLPGNHRYLGPILWSPPVAKPEWWDALPAEKPIIYLTLGSSGQACLLPMLLQALAGLPVTVIAATAGASLPQPPANAYVAGYLPGTEAAARARLVICNGGSPTSQQALAAGVPVLGIASNMDQFLNMEAVARRGAGILLRADRLSPAKIRAAVAGLLAGSAYRDNAMKLARAFGREAAPARFASFVNEVTGGE